MKLKSIIGIFLILLSLAGMYFWETRVRDRMLFTEVLAAATDINEGDELSGDMLKVISVSSSNLVKGYMTENERSSVTGKVCVFPFKENAVVFSSAFEEKKDSDDGTFVFIFPEEWIFSKNTLLKKGSFVQVYIMPEKTFIGIYKVSSSCDEYTEVYCPLKDYFEIAGFAASGDKKILLVSGDD